MKMIYALLIVTLLTVSGCIYPKNKLQQAQITERFSIAPSTNNVKFVYNGENFDYAISTVVDTRMFGKWTDVSDFTTITLTRDIDNNGNISSTIEFNGYTYPMMYFNTYAFIISNDDLYLTIDSLTEETMTITLHTPDGEFPRNFVRDNSNTDSKLT